MSFGSGKWRNEKYGVATFFYVSQIYHFVREVFPSIDMCHLMHAHSYERMQIARRGCSRDQANLLQTCKTLPAIKRVTAPRRTIAPEFPRMLNHPNVNLSMLRSWLESSHCIAGSNATTGCPRIAEEWIRGDISCQVRRQILLNASFEEDD